MTSAPPGGDEERTRIAEPDEERTRIATSQEEQTRIVEREDEPTRIAPSSASAATLMVTTMATKSATTGAPPASLGHNAFEVGTKIGEFEILDLVGEGGFGIVYLAHDHSLDRKVALKEYMPAQLAAREGGTVVMRSDRHAETFSAGLRSFINEARLLAQFDHHSLVKVYRFWEANGTAYMVMPFYEGITLKRALQDLGTPPDEAWLKSLLVHLLDALEVIHNRQCYHRDIAPDNILILPDGSPLLLDFGAARRVIGDMTQALTVILKPGYAPIEQYAEMPNMKQGAWTDLYALASVVYFAITGRAPVPSVARVMSDALVPLVKSAAGRYSEPFLRALDQALSVKPEDRPQNIAEFRRALGLPEREPATRYVPSGSAQAAPAAKPEARALPAAAPAPAPVQAPVQAGGPRGGRYAMIGGAVLAVLVVGGYLLYAFMGTPREAPKGPVDTPAEAPVASPGTAAAPNVAEAIRQKLAGFDCARLDAGVDQGAARIRGHVTSDADLQKLTTDLGGVKGISRVDASAVQVVPPSYCAVVAMLAPVAAPAAGPPSIGLKNGEAAAFEGDKLVTEVTTAGFPGFVYADLYDHEGNVVHLLPNAKDSKNQVQPGQRLVIGDDAIFGMQWDIVPPFGKHLLVVTVSRSKLFDRERPDIEAAHKYVGAMQVALKKSPQNAVANYRFVDFSARR